MIPARSRDGCRKDSFLNVAAVTLPVECRLPARYRNSVKVECRFEGPKVALRRHSTGTTRSPHDLVNDAERFTSVNVAPAIWRWRWHWRWCCRPQQRSERGPGEARAQLCELHGRSRPPDCCTGSPWPTQIAQRSRCPSPQPKATSQAGLHRPAWTRRPWGGLGRSQRCTGRVADSDLHCKRQFTRAARRPQRPALPRRPCGSTRSGRPDASFCDQGPPRAPGRQPRALRPSSGSMASG